MSVQTTFEPTPKVDSPPSTAAGKANVGAMRAIALFEAGKGFIALAASLGLLSLLHRDLHHLAVALIDRFGLDPDDHYPAIILHYADVLNNANVRQLVLLAIAYVTVRLAEAYGLWYDRAWGQWLGALSGALYVPLEVRHFHHRPNLINLAVVVFNIVIVVYLVVQLWRRRTSQAT